MTQVVLVHAAAAGEDGAASVVIGPESIEPNETAADVAARSLDALVNGLPEFAMEEEGEATFGANTGYLRRYVYRAPRGQQMQQQFFTVLDNCAYVLTYTNQLLLFSSAQHDAEQIFSNFKLFLPKL